MERADSCGELLNEGISHGADLLGIQRTSIPELFFLILLSLKKLFSSNTASPLCCVVLSRLTTLRREGKGKRKKENWANKRTQKRTGENCVLRLIFLFDGRILRYRLACPLPLARIFVSPGIKNELRAVKLEDRISGEVPRHSCLQRIQSRIHLLSSGYLDRSWSRRSWCTNCRSSDD